MEQYWPLASTTLDSAPNISLAISKRLPVSLQEISFAISSWFSFSNAETHH